MSERWRDYFKKTVNKYNSLLEMAVEHWNYNIPLYQKIKKCVKPPAKILDVGCGYGLSSIYLQECGYQVTAVDNDPTIVSYAKESAEYFKSKLIIEKADAFDLSKYYDKFDLVFSVGLIEHFEKEQTVKLLQEQAKCGKYVIALVPTIYSYKLLERCEVDWIIYNHNELKKVFREAGFKKIRIFGYGDVYSPFHVAIKYLIPYGLYRFLQNYFSYAMGVGCIGKNQTKI